MKAAPSGPWEGPRAAGLTVQPAVRSVGGVFSRRPSQRAMATRRTEYELAVEQELPAGPDGAPRRARFTARFHSDPPDSPPDPAALAAALGELADQLARATEAARLARPHLENRPDRTLEELFGTYRPRQKELVELLHAEGELTDGEYTLLRDRLPEVAAGPASMRSGPETAPPASRPTGRSVEELLRTYQITSLRQAGAVRARRQISFDEYMSLKRHFAASETPPTTGSPSA